MTRTGTKTFQLKQWNRRYSLGRYPYVTLKDARTEAHRRLGERYNPLRLGQNSHQAHELVELYLQAKSPSLRPVSIAHMRDRLKYLPDKRIGDISARDLREAYAFLLHQNIIHTGFKAFLNWCAQNDYIAENPLRYSKAPHKTTTRGRLLTDDEIRADLAGELQSQFFRRDSTTSRINRTKAEPNSPCQKRMDRLHLQRNRLSGIHHERQHRAYDPPHASHPSASTTPRTD